GPWGRHGLAAPPTRGNRWIRSAGSLPGGRLPIGHPYGPARQPYRPLDRGGRVLVRADGLGGGVEAPAPLGADDSGLPAGGLFLQHFEQRHDLAVALARSRALCNLTRGS